MKRHLILSLLLIKVVDIFPYGEYNFSEPPFGLSPTVDFASSFTVNNLTVGTNGTSLWQLTPDPQTIDARNFTHRLQSVGGGGVVPPAIPTGRFLKFNSPMSVDGVEVIIGMKSSSSTVNRTLVVVAESFAWCDSITNINGTASTYYFSCPGVPDNYYFYSKSGGIDFYYIVFTPWLPIKENKTDKPYTISPNPVSNFFIFRGNTDNAHVKIFNLSGSLLITKQLLGEESIPIDNLPSGMYVVEVITNKGVERLKMIKK